MKIGFLGAGEVAQTYAKHFLAQGHEVILSNSRGPESLETLIKELGSKSMAGTPRQIAEQDIVVLAVGWLEAQKALSVIPSWEGKILIDATNRFASMKPFSAGDISGRTSSEIIADLAPGAKLIKTFNTVAMGWISDFSSSKEKTALFVSGDDGEAKKIVCELIDEMGFASFDIGSLASGGRLQQLGGPLFNVRLVLKEKSTIT